MSKADSVGERAVSELLDQIPQERREQFDKQLIEHLYQKYQSHAVNDLDAIDARRQKMEGRKVLVLAAGQIHPPPIRTGYRNSLTRRTPSLSA